MPRRNSKKLVPASRLGKKLSSGKGSAVEIYTDERVAEFLLNNSVNKKDYALATKLVEKMGLDPRKIDHDPQG